MKNDITTGEALQNVAAALHALGNGDASTTMGAIEGYAVVVKEALDRHAVYTSESLSEVANALLAIADAIREKNGSADR